MLRDCLSPRMICPPSTTKVECGGTILEKIETPFVGVGTGGKKYFMVPTGFEIGQMAVLVLETKSLFLP